MKAAASGLLPFGAVGSRVSNKPYFVYVLWSASGTRFYVGVSENPEGRLQQHNSGELRGWTKRYRPWEIVHKESFPTYGEARRRELLLKAQKAGAGFFAKTGLDPRRFGRGS